jgi:hypothetical protein
MKISIGCAAAATLAAVVASPGLAQEPRREMNVQQGPESVFAEVPGQIFPALENAMPTGMNGRIGNELVFWGFRQSNGRHVYLVACAMLARIDCTARESRVCSSGTEVIARSTSQGLVRELNCRSIATVAPGDIRPGCTDRETPKELAVSLVTCS